MSIQSKIYALESGYHSVFSIGEIRIVHRYRAGALMFPGFAVIPAQIMPVVGAIGIGGMGSGKRQMEDPLSAAMPVPYNPVLAAIAGTGNHFLLSRRPNAAVM